MISNLERRSGSLAEAVLDADVFIGVSAPNSLTPAMIKTMRPKPIIFALANPVPEIMPDEALAAGAFLVGTGRSDFPNQVNNVLAFPGIFRGAIDARASVISDRMKLAAAHALAATVSDPRPDYIIPSPLEKHVAHEVARAVKEAYLKIRKDI